MQEWEALGAACTHALPWVAGEAWVGGTGSSMHSCSQSYTALGQGWERQQHALSCWAREQERVGGSMSGMHSALRCSSALPSVLGGWEQRAFHTPWECTVTAQRAFQTRHLQPATLMDCMHALTTARAQRSCTHALTVAAFHPCPTHFHPYLSLGCPPT